MSVHGAPVREPERAEEGVPESGRGRVVVEHEGQSLEGTQGAQRLQRHAVRKRRLAHDGHDVRVSALQVARGRHPLRRRKRGARVAGHERVAGRLLGIGEAGEPAQPPKRVEGAVASREDLPRVCLMADVPHDPVARRFEHAHQADREFHRAKRRGEMPAVRANDVENARTHVAREPRQFPHGQRLHLRRRHFSPPGLASLRVKNSNVVAFCPKFGSVAVNA